MKTERRDAARDRTLTLGLMVAFIALYLSDLATVPFHPDESTHIHMSRDFFTLVVERNPTVLYWQPGQPLSPETEFRLLDAPLTRYLIGVSEWLSGYAPDDLSRQWLWGPTWDDNVQSGRLPHAEVLLAARVPPAVLGALAAVCVFWLGHALGGWEVGLVAALLLAFDPLNLLHTRRAMAEGALMFSMALAAWGGLRFALACDEAKEWNWRLAAGAALVGVLCGLALTSKQTLVVLLPVIMIAAGAAVWQRPWPRRQKTLALTVVWLAIGLGAAITFWLLNPILWPNPALNAIAILAKRAQLLADQLAVNNPTIVLATPGQRLAAAINAVFLQPPVPLEALVYLEQLTPPAERYLSVSWHTALRAPGVGWALLAFSLAGLLASVRHLPAHRPTQFLWLWATTTLVLIALTIPLAWQRYFLPLLPIVHLSASLGVVTLIRALRRTARLKVHAV